MSIPTKASTGKRSKIPADFQYMLTCQKCRLAGSRQNVVVGRGPTKGVRFVFIGEAPGANEDESGQPFVGRAGERLSELMADAGLDENEVYITNIVKCRPPENRRPSGHELKACQAHLIAQLAKIKPAAIVTIGNTSLQFFFPKAKIMSVHGQVLTTRRGRRVYPLIHPAAALRNPEYDDLILEDLRRLAQLDLTDTVAFGPTVLEA